MPRITPPFEDKIRRAIRDTKAVDPLITQQKLRETLDRKFSHSFSPEYVRKLASKVGREVRLEADYKAIESRLSEIRETFRMGRERLLRIIYWTSEERDIMRPRSEEIVKAVTALVQLDLAILEAELNAGMYKKNEETIIAELRYKPLPADMREQIVLTYRRWGRLPEAAVQEIAGPETHERITESTPA
jgi:hypothetical protein